MPIDPHRLAELRSLAFHRAIAEKLRRDPDVLARARARTAAWLAEPSRTSGAARDWAEVLSGDIDSVCAFLVDTSERATALRQSTPFAGALDPRERWRIWRDVRESEESRIG